MAREKFFLDQEEDPIHANQIVLKTAKEKRANWWYYHKVHLLIGFIAVLAVGGIIYSMVTKVYPDYTIALLTQNTYSAEVTERLAEELEAYADDRNNDGQVIVRVATYAIGSDSSGDVQVQQANQVRFMGDTSTFESVIYITDDESFKWIQSQDGFFTYMDGTTPEADATDYDNMRIAWGDCKALTEMDLSIDVLDKEQAQKYMSPLSLSTRLIEGTTYENDEGKKSYYEDSRRLLERLISGEKLSSEESSQSE